MATDQGAAPATRAYSLLALLTAINVLNFVDRQLLPSFANFIVPDLKLTDTEFGLLTGLFFIIFYAVAGLFMGALADLVHRPRLIAPWGFGARSRPPPAPPSISSRSPYRARSSAWARAR